MLGGKDEYSNLLYFTYNVHKTIHAKEIEAINNYMKMENLKSCYRNRAIKL